MQYEGRKMPIRIWWCDGCFSVLYGYVHLSSFKNARGCVRRNGRGRIERNVPHPATGGRTLCAKIVIENAKNAVALMTCLL